MAVVDEDAGYVWLFFALVLGFIIYGIIFHWFDGVISFIWLSIQVLVVFLIIGGVSYLIYYLINRSKYGETLSQYSRPWIGIVLIISLFIFAEYLFLKYGFLDGFTVAAISYQVVMAAVIFCIVATPLILEKSYISTKNAMYILCSFIIGTILGTLSENFGGNWVGRVFFIWFFISMIFVILYVIVPEIIAEKAKNQYIRNYNDEPQIRSRFTGNKITIHDIDGMEGIEFELVLKALFQNMGYSAVITPPTNDYGADLILSIPGQRISVQAKNWEGNVGIDAVQQVVSTLKHYDTQRGIVVCSSDFTNQAITLAASNHVELWNRDKLIEMLNRYPVSNY
jgi:hypothetical protein